MKNSTSWLKGATAAALAAALLASGASAANADPVGAPSFRALAGVGSDTTQDLYNGLSDVVSTGSTKLLGSYNATGSATIQTKSGGTVFNRPNGSGNGVTALRSAKDTTTLWGGQNLTSNDLQFARSSSGATWQANGTYSYIPIALDAVSYAKGSSAAAPGNIPLGTSVGQDSDGDGILDLTLINIYTRNATTTLETASNVAYTVGDQASGAQIVPFKPQAGSGTLSFWTSTLGGTLGSIVKDTYTDATGSHSVQEHNGAVTTAVPNAIVPFSVAQWIAQKNHETLTDAYGVEVIDRRGTATLGQINGKSPVTSSNTLNTSFDVVRPVFTVVQFAELSTNTNLASVFSGPTGKAYTALRPGSTSDLVITDFGFGDLSGGVTINGVTYNEGDTTSFRVN